jgi:hypothetical protein
MSRCVEQSTAAIHERTVYDEIGETLSQLSWQHKQKGLLDPRYLVLLRLRGWVVAAVEDEPPSPEWGDADLRWVA